MEIKVPRADLARLISAVSRVVESRNTIPILSTIKLEFDGEILKATATDLDIVATASCAAEGKAGGICIEAKILGDIVKKAPDDISLKVDGERAIVKSGRSRFTVNYLPVADFPSLGQAPNGASFEIDLAALFAPVQFAISTEETRFYLNGIFMHVDEGGKLRAVATDGHRLSLHETDLPEGAVEMPALIVPRKLVSIVPKGAARVSVDERQIQIESGEISLVSKMIDGTFPDYKRVIPQGGDIVMTACREVLTKATDRVSIIASDRGRAVRLSMASDALTLDLASSDGDEASEEIAVQFGSEPMTIGFNSRYLVEALSTMPAGDVVLTMSDPAAPAVLTSAASDAVSITLMPMRV